jgi:hypothetical protein
MALDFDAAGSTRMVDHGSNANIDNLPQTVGGMTVWAWAYRTADGANQVITTKDTGSTGFLLFADNGAGEGQLRLIVWRATRSDFASAAAVIPLNTWVFIAATYDQTLGTPMDLYSGSLGAAPTETGYGTTQNGSGAFASDAAVNLRVGGNGVASPFRGRIARGGVIARRLTLAQIQQLWSDSRKLAGFNVSSNVANTVILFDYKDTSNVTDLSGSGNNGAVTAATNADHPLFHSSLSYAGVG